MEGRESAESPSRVVHGPFGGYFYREGGYSLMANPSSIIHPTAMRHIPNTNPNLNTDLNANCIVPNLNPNAVPSPSPNSSNSAFFDADAAVPAAPTPRLGLMANMGERSLSQPEKRKRGRPRKYDRDVNGGGTTGLSSPLSKPSVSSSAPKKRAPPSGKKAQLSALGAGGQNFTPYVLTVAAGEDVSTKIITFTSQGPWAVCILSANGAISNATLRHAGVSGGAVTYEGRFEILSLSGSFLLTENDGTRSRTGGLSVSLAGPDGRVIGGGVAGLLMAASPVQVVVGTFFTGNQKKEKSGVATSSGIKQLTDGGAGAEPSPSALLDVNADGMETMPHHSVRGSEEGQEHSRGHYAVQLQSMDWDSNNFDTDTRDDTDQATSPGEP